MSRPEPTLGIVAALEEELAPLAHRLRDAHDGCLGDLEVRRGRLNGRSVCLAVGGVGRRRAAAAARALLSQESTVSLLGIGIAGGLSSELETGDVVWSRRVREPSGAIRTPPGSEWRDRAAAITGVQGGTLVAMDQIVGSAQAKAELASELALDGPVVVDLESAGWAEIAEEKGAPWLILRAVSDSLDEALPLDFERFRTADGSISRARVLAHASVRPGLLLRLDGLRRTVKMCALRLADAVEELTA